MSGDQRGPLTTGMDTGHWCIGIGRTVCRGAGIRMVSVGWSHLVTDQHDWQSHQSQVPEINVRYCALIQC